MTNLNPDVVIRAGRDAYRTASGMGRNYILRAVAVDLGLEGEDYEDLVYHLVTAKVIDEDAWRWVTQTGERAETARSTVPEGSQGGDWNVSTTTGWSGRTTGGH